MPKKTKITGKGRLDKFYKLAKEHGYRSRAAFKLVQLSKQFDIFKKVRVCVDLCAAPGGWLQVASHYLPPNSIIVGVDLDAIPPIKGVVTLVSDITTAQCTNAVREELHGNRADIVLHDGAPNMGASWIQDAYDQNRLVLSALKMATTFLNAGGTFLTKVFRSADYNSLLWAFNQLFTKVDVTKPPASRRTSAEIFVICRGYKDPKKIDPKLLDAKHIFASLNDNPQIHTPFSKAALRANRSGYEEGQMVLFKKCPVLFFIQSAEPIKLVVTHNVFEFDESSTMIEEHPATSEEIKHICSDLKLLSKNQFKSLLRWRLKMREALAKAGRDEDDDDEKDQKTEKSVDEALSSKLDKLSNLEKRKKKKAQKKRKHDALRLALKISLPKDKFLDNKDILVGDEDDSMDEALKALLPKPEKKEDVDDVDPELEQLEDEEAVFDEMYEKYKAKRKNIAGAQAVVDRDYKTLHKIGGDQDEDEEMDARFQALPTGVHIKSDVDNLDEEEKNQHTSNWYKQSIFEGIQGADQENEDDEYDEEEMERKRKKRKIGDDDAFAIIPKSKIEAMVDDDEDRPDEEDDEDSSCDTEERVELLALGKKLLRRKSRLEMIDDGYNRRAFNDKGPAWFSDEEKRAHAIQRPDTKEDIKEMRKRFQDINARPIKKIAEARARKQKKITQRINKMKKKAQNITQNSDLSAKAKVKELERLKKRTKIDPKKEKKYVVSRKGKTNAAVRGGRFIKVVDKRLKKDKRADKANAKRAKKTNTKFSGKRKRT